MANVKNAQEIQTEHGSTPTPTPQGPDLEKSFTVDTVHQDEALRVLANYDGQETWDKEEEKQLRKKIDRRLLPILCVTYALQYYDKGMTFLSVMSTTMFLE